MCIPEVRVDGRLSLHYSPPRKRSVFGQGTRYTDPPNGRKVLALHHISELRSAQHLSAILTSSHSHIPKMAARSCVARAARQLTFAAARRPAPFACQRGQLQAQKQRLFSDHEWIEMSADGKTCMSIASPYFVATILTTSPRHSRHLRIRRQSPRRRRLHRAAANRHGSQRGRRHRRR
jgi:hypothetical protein